MYRTPPAPPPTDCIRAVRAGIAERDRLRRALSKYIGDVAWTGPAIAVHEEIREQEERDVKRVSGLRGLVAGMFTERIARIENDKQELEAATARVATLVAKRESARIAVAEFERQILALAEADASLDAAIRERAAPVLKTATWTARRLREVDAVLAVIDVELGKVVATGPKLELIERRDELALERANLVERTL